MTGVGRAMLVALLLVIADTLKIIYGIAAGGNVHFFTNTQSVVSRLPT